MSDNNKLFVPIEIQTMVVNDQSRKAENFQRWQMNYKNLESYASPMPNAFSGNTAVDWNNNPDANGVYLHWTLPHALRVGQQNNTSGLTEYPLVPNRWLVVRYNGSLEARTASAWIIESDFLDPNHGTSPYIDPNQKDKLAVTLIGRKVDLSSWKEGASKELFLTAVGTGDITFGAYQPYNENVFSIHDPLTNVTDQVLSYMVAGWYSDPSKDILASVKDEETFNNVLSTLNWKVEAPIQPCSISVYQGMSYGIQWSKTGAVPVSGRPNTATLSVGNTSIDALTALIEKQSVGSSTIDAQLLEAFQYNLLPLLDEPNGADLLYQSIRKAWYGTFKGGYEWVIVKSPSDSGGSLSSSVDWDDPNLDPEWLSILNQKQSSYDNDWRQLQSLQWKLYRMWWTKGKFDNIGSTNQSYLTSYDPDITGANFDNELDATKANSTAQLVQKQIELVTKQLAAIPSGETQSILQKSIENYGQVHQLPKGYELKRYNKEAFHKANDPVVLINGSGSSAPLVDDSTLLCRFESQLISGLSYQSHTIDTASMKGEIPTVDFTKVPSIPMALLKDFFFLDPNNATLMASIALGDSSSDTISKLTAQIDAHQHNIGVLPAMTLTSWKQPWSPMFLLWTVMYYPINHDVNGVENWSFDGQKYILSDKNIPESDPQNIVLSGATLLTPQSSFNFKKRLTEYREKHPKIDKQELQALEDFITTTDDWDFLSQTLDGFMHQLINRDHESNVVPSVLSPTGKLLGSNNSIIPALGAVPQPFEGWPTSDFQAYRSGQFCFQKLTLVDQFGQALQLSSTKDYLQLKPVISPDMKPEHTVLSQEPYRFIQLSPSMLQPARLNFDFVSANDDTKIINLNSGINPVCAWVLPNHIDKSLACYDPSGEYLGELRVITNSQAQKVVHWDMAPNSSYTDLNNIVTVFPHLGQMLKGLIAKGSDGFVNFYQIIDETLWVVDPLGSRSDQSTSVLVGRPLALTRSRLKYELEGPAVTDPSWEFTFKKAASVAEGYTFPIRLGELKLRNDGLIGYFDGSDYSKFNCVHMPKDGTITPTSPPYNVEIKQGNFIDQTFKDDSESYITMLIDPRASIHATTAILPTKILELPSKFIEPALTNMDITFRAGPILSKMVVSKEKTTDDSDELAVLLPKPMKKVGDWSWLEKEDNAWKNYVIKPIDQKANFSNQPSTLKSGMFKLSGAIKKNN